MCMGAMRMVGPVGLEPTTRGLKVAPKCLALTAFTLRRCRPTYAETCHRQGSWLYQWLYERGLRLIATQSPAKTAVSAVSSRGRSAVELSSHRSRGK
jgi:hypothetical protein